MRIILLLDNHRILHPQFLVRVAKRITVAGHLLSVGIVTSPTPAPGVMQWWRAWYRKFTFVGGVQGCAKLLGRYLVGEIGQWWSTGSATWSLEHVCRRHGVTWFKTADVNASSVVESLRDFCPDLLLSMQSQIVREELLRVPRIGCLNRHAGLLPKYRGIWPVFWALLQGETECVDTWHWMTSTIDRGDIMHQEVIPVEASDTVFAVYRRLFDRLPETIMRLLHAVEQQEIPSIPNTGDGAYYSFPSRADVRQLYRIRRRRVV